MEKLINVGVDVPEQRLFEGQYKVANGMAYNSYLLTGDKICLFDTVDELAESRWLDNLESALDGKSIDYLIISHVEPDHSYSLGKLISRYPDVKVIATNAAFKIISQFYSLPIENNKIIVKDGDTIDIGDSQLHFFTAPMVHWPEVMVTYDSYTKTLFSADAFGRFGIGAHTDDWADDAREYYINIVGKYGVQTQALLKKISALDINRICPLHGNMLTENLPYYIGLYDTWSSYRPETDGVFIAYTTVYGHTEQVALKLYRDLSEKGIRCSISNLADSEMSENIEQAFRYSHIVLATTTYENDIFPAMNDYLNHLAHKGYQNRTVGIIENGSWALAAGKMIKAKLECMKNITILEPMVSILSAPDNNTYKKLAELEETLTNDIS